MSTATRALTRALIRRFPPAGDHHPHPITLKAAQTDPPPHSNAWETARALVDQLSGVQAPRWEQASLHTGVRERLILGS